MSSGYSKWLYAESTGLQEALLFVLTEPHSLTYGYFLKKMAASPVVHSDPSIKKEPNKFSLLTQDL